MKRSTIIQLAIGAALVAAAVYGFELYNRRRILQLAGGRDALQPVQPENLNQITLDQDLVQLPEIALQ